MQRGTSARASHRNRPSPTRYRKTSCRARRPVRTWPRHCTSPLRRYRRQRRAADCSGSIRYRLALAAARCHRHAGRAGIGGSPNHLHGYNRSRRLSRVSEFGQGRIGIKLSQVAGGLWAEYYPRKMDLKSRNNHTYIISSPSTGLPALE